MENSQQNILAAWYKFDTDITDKLCRLGFYGFIIEILTEEDLKKEKKLKIIR